MKTKNKHGRVGVKKPLSQDQRREAFRKGYKAGADWIVSKVAGAKNLRDLKKELFIS
jgi:hypothetical protein